MKILIVFLDLKFSSTILSFLGTMITDVYRVTVVFGRILTVSCIAQG